MRCVVVLPTYNERENIRAILHQVLEALDDGSILVVDDSSPDGTADVVREFQGSHARVDLLVRPEKSGLGSAYVDAFERLLSRGDADVIVTMDADFSHAPSTLPRLIAATSAHDVVVGSRYVRGGGISSWEVWRRALSWAGNLYARIVAGVPVRDLTSGFVAFRREILERVDLTRINSSGYAYTIESKCLAHRAGARIVEVPITFQERRAGQSKLSGRIVREGLLAPWRARLG